MIDCLIDEEEKVASEISPFVEVDGKAISKSTLVNQLNGNPTLFKDRLTRVKSGVYFSLEKKAMIHTRTCLGIGCDCAVLFESTSINANKKTRGKGKAGNTSKGAVNNMWYLGRVVSMRRKVGNCLKETRGPFDLLDRPLNVQIHLSWYQQAKGTRTYTYDLVDNQCVDLESIIALANLNYDRQTKKYHLDENDYKLFNECVQGKKGTFSIF